jgi:hypothetical protein
MNITLYDIPGIVIVSVQNWLPLALLIFTLIIIFGGITFYIMLNGGIK